MYANDTHYIPSEVQEACSKPVEYVKEHPVSSLVVVFGLGLGIGALLSHTLAPPLARVFQSDPTMAEKLGRQIYDAVAGAVPESLMRHVRG